MAETKDKHVVFLKKRPDYLRVAASRKRWVSTSMIIQTCEHDPKNDPDQVRVGLTASKKVGNAVVRNRTRRRLREIVRQIFPRHAKRGHDYVIIARNGCDEKTFDDLIRDAKWCLKRLHQPPKIPTQQPEKTA